MMNITIPALEIQAEPSPYTFDEHLIIRFPISIAGAIRTELQENNQPGDLSITFVDERHARVKFDSRVYPAILVDLPTLLESHKTLDHGQYYKIGDIHQMLLVVDPQSVSEDVKGLFDKVERNQYQWSDGLTPPMRNVKERRFGANQRGRETTKTLEDIEQAVQRLVNADDLAQESRYTLYDGNNRIMCSGGGGVNGMGVEFERSLLDPTHPTMTTLHEDQSMALDGEDNSERNEETITEPDEDDFADFAAEIEYNMMEDVGTRSKLVSVTTSVTSSVDQPAKADASASGIGPNSVAHVVAKSSPVLEQLQRRLEEKRQQLSLVTNPMIKARLEEVVRQLENELQTKMSAFNLD